MDVAEVCAKRLIKYDNFINSLLLLNFLGKRTGSGPGPGRPPKYPNLNTEDAEINRPIGAGGSGGSSSGGLVDILNQLDSGKRNEMLALVGQYKGRTLGLNDFMLRARELLGERLYNQLARDMSNAAASRGAGISQVAQAQNNIPLMPTHMPGIPHQMRPPVSASQMPMHSMPLIYSGGPMPNPNPMIPILQAGAASSGPVEVDVTKMDTSSLQDVMQYSGVDLKAEAELLYRENDISLMGSGSAAAASVDHRLKFDYFFNPFKFRAIVQHALQRHFFSSTLGTGTTGNDPSKLNKPLGISEEGVHLLGIAIQKRLIGILRRLSEISRHRVDYGRGRFKIKIENDPKKQLWLQEKLFIEGVGEDKRRTIANSAGNTGNTGNTSTSTTQTTANPTTNQTLLNPPSLATVNAAASAKSTSAPSKSAATSTANASASTGDDTVKTKLANSTALAALGVRQKSWMSAASIGTGSSTTTSSSTSNSASSQPQNATDTNDEKESIETYQHPLASFYSLPSSTPLTDAELRAQYFNRTIALVDLITCMETDPHLKRSRLLAVLYEALPRENKENSKESKDNE